MTYRTNTDERLSLQLRGQLSQPRHRTSLLEIAGSLVRSLTGSLFRPKGLTAGVFITLAAVSGGTYLSRSSADRLSGNPSAPQPVSETQAQTASLQSVTLQTAETATIKDTLTLTGTVAAENLLRVTPSVEGLRILEMRAAEGDFVAAGEVLAVLDDRVLRSQFRQAQAALVQAETDFQRQEAKLVQAQVTEQAAVVDMQRYERLYRQGAVSQAQLSNLQVQALTAREGVAVDMASLEGARAAIASRLAEIDGLETLLAQAIVTAPTAGIIAKRNTTIGDTATAGQPLYSLIEAGELTLKITPSQPQLAKLEVGTPVTVSTVDGAQQFEIQSRVSSIDPTLDEQSRQATVNIALPTDAAAYSLRPGMFLQAEVVIGQRRSVVVPAAAVINQPDGTAIVFTLDERSQGKSHPNANVVKANVVDVVTRPDQLPTDPSAITAANQTANQAANQVEILSGLSPGSRIVVSGASYLQPDDRVSIVPETSP